MEDHVPVRVIRGTDFRQISSGNFNEVPARYEKARAVTKRLLRPGDIVLEISGGNPRTNQSTGRSILVRQHHLAVLGNAIPASFCRLVRVDEAQALPSFVAYYLRRLYMSGEARRYENQSTGISNFQFKYFCEEAPLPLPSLAEQRRITRVLDAIEQKVQRAREIARQLAGLQSLLFHRWLREVGGASGTEGTLLDLAHFINGKNFTKDASGFGRPVVRIRELKEGVTGSTILSDVDVAEEHLARHFDLLFAWSGSLGSYRWEGPDAVINQHIFKVIPKGYPLWFVEDWLEVHMPSFRAVAQDKATTMGHIQRHHLRDARVVLPGGEELADLGRALRPIEALRAVISSEIFRLTSTRDCLLPDLVSGRRRVPQSYDAARAQDGAERSRIAA